MIVYSDHEFCTIWRKRRSPIAVDRLGLVDQLASDEVVEASGIKFKMVATDARRGNL